MVTDTSIWNALADPKRRQIIALLEQKPRTTSELCGYFDVSRFAVMKHLKVLEQANLITSQRQGRARWHALNSDLLEFLGARLDEIGGAQRLTSAVDLVPRSGLSGPQAAELAEATRITLGLFLEAAPEAVFAAMVEGINRWWQPRAKAGSTMFIEPYAGGRFYEAFEDGDGGILYAQVTAITWDKEMCLRCTSEFGERIADVPFLDSIVRLVLQQAGEGSMLSLTQNIAGGADELARQAFEDHWRHVLEHNLSDLVKTGLPYQHEP